MPQADPQHRFPLAQASSQQEPFTALQVFRRQGEAEQPIAVALTSVQCFSGRKQLDLGPRHRRTALQVGRDRDDLLAQDDRVEAQIGHREGDRRGVITTGARVSRLDRGRPQASVRRQPQHPRIGAGYACWQLLSDALAIAKLNTQRLTGVVVGSGRTPG